MTVDYRGVGGSPYGLQRQSDAALSHWCAPDLSAAGARAAERGPVRITGHSLGGHATGRLPDPARLRAARPCRTGAGCAGWMSRPEAARFRYPTAPGVPAADHTGWCRGEVDQELRRRVLARPTGHGLCLAPVRR